jgi:hypothetical protein
MEAAQLNFYVLEATVILYEEDEEGRTSTDIISIAGTAPLCDLVFLSHHKYISVNKLYPKIRQSSSLLPTRFAERCKRMNNEVVYFPRRAKITITWARSTL